MKCLNNCMILKFYSTSWSFGSQRFRLKYVTNTDKQLFNNSADSLISSKQIYYPLFQSCAVFTWHIFIPIVHMHLDPSCSSHAFDETMQLLLCWFISLSSLHTHDPSQLLIFGFCKKFIIVLISQAYFCNPIPLKYGNLLIFKLCYLFLHWCYKEIGAELVVWSCTCVTIAPVYSCIMFFKTIFIWIII